MLFFLVLGRWLLPKGEISRNQLSELLLVYIGSASDIMDLFGLFEVEKVVQDVVLENMILAVWSISLLQFAFVLTATRKRRMDPEIPRGRCHTACCYTGIWGYFVLILLQDGPFLAIRIFIMVDRGAFTYTIFFFSLKNAVVIVLYLYRVICSILEVYDIYPKVSK